MAGNVTKLPVKTDVGDDRATVSTGWHPRETLHREIDRLFDDFGGGAWRLPFGRTLFGVEPAWRGEMSWGAVPAVDLVEQEKAYQITAELPGIDEKNVEIKVSNGTLSIRGEKSEDRQEKSKDLYLSERRYGAFERSFRLPDGVDADKIEASFKKGVLTVRLPKKAEALKPEKKITVKAA